VEDTIKKLIDIAEKIGAMDEKLDGLVKSQDEVKEDLGLIKACYTEHSERITKAEEKIEVLEKNKSGFSTALITILFAILAAVLGHMIGR